MLYNSSNSKYLLSNSILALSIATLFSISFINTAFAATDSDVEFQANTTANIFLSIPQSFKTIGVKNFELSDFNLDSTAPNQFTVTGSHDFNILMNFGDEKSTYSVTAIGNGENGEFILKNDQKSVPFKVFYNDKAGTQGRTALVARKKAKGFVSAKNDSGLNSNLSIDFNKADLNKQDLKGYNGLLTLFYAPD